ncbi:hypothetical protein HQ576_16770, partial [bacterium]|nr:hypothetical protein [bacterium]
KPFRARFLRTQGFQNERSKQMVVLELDDGRTRGWPVLSFSDADQAHVERVSATPPGKKAQEKDYELVWQDYDAEKDKDHVNVHGTRHFAFWWGNTTDGSGKVWAQPAMREMNFRYYEAMWDYYARQVKAPMPMADADKPRKINVYVTGTGLPKHKEGWAFGAKAIVIHPNAMLEGSSVIPHEFGHCLQFYSGGFRNSPYVGWFWECHANWHCHQFIPSYPPVLGWYYNRKHYELSSTRMNYGSWPFLQYMHENPRFPPGFCYRVWKDNRKNNLDQSIENPFQTLMRVGAELGIYEGDGVKGFGDTIGEMAARLVTMDFVYQQNYLDNIHVHRGAHWFMPFRTVLEPVPDRPGWYRPPYAFAPAQYGVNIIDLVPDDGSPFLAIDLKGIVDEAQHSDWRATIVLIDEQGRARYSRMWNAGKCTIVRRPNERRAALAIAATPSQYTPLRFRMGYHVKRRYPYEVAFGGCVPADRDVWHPTHKGIAGKHHRNGGGFVAKTAHVDATAYVGPDAQALDAAKVTGNARIEDHAVVRGRAQVTDHAIVSGWAIVEGRAKVSGYARVRDRARIVDDVHVVENARVLEFAKIKGVATVQGHAIIKGFADVNNRRNDPANGEPPRRIIGGSAIIGRDAEYHGQPQPVLYGRMYSYTTERQINENVDGRYLYANWTFDQPNSAFALDAWEYNDGFLRGKPTYTTDGDRKVLALDGTDDYVLVGNDCADWRDVTIDLLVKWTGSRAGQRLFDFGTAPDNCMYLTPKDADGKLAFAIVHGGKTQQLRADAPLPANQWARIRLELNGDTGTLYRDGKPVATAPITLDPEMLRATDCTLGRGRFAGSFFRGMLDHVRIYSRVVDGFDALPEPPPCESR